VHIYLIISLQVDDDDFYSTFAMQHIGSHCTI